MTVSKATGKPIVMACAAIQSSSGAFLGVLGTVIKADFFTSLVAGRKIGETRYGDMINNKGIILAHPKPEHVLKLNVTKIEAMQSINRKMIAGESGVEEYTFKGSDKIAGFAPVDVNGWAISATQDQKEFLAASISIRNSNIIVALIAGLITAFVVLLASRSIVRPINAAVAGASEEMSSTIGEISQNAEKARGISDEAAHKASNASTNKDELGNAANSIGKVIETITDISEQVNLSAQELSKLSESLKRMVDQFKV